MTCFLQNIRIVSNGLVQVMTGVWDKFRLCKASHKLIIIWLHLGIIVCPLLGLHYRLANSYPYH